MERRKKAARALARGSCRLEKIIEEYEYVLLTGAVTEFGLPVSCFYFLFFITMGLQFFLPRNQPKSHNERES
jgi:hypothetical protein